MKPNFIQKVTASDVHGKNYHTEGCFSDWLIEFSLMNEICLTHLMVHYANY